MSRSIKLASLMLLLTTPALAQPDEPRPLTPAGSASQPAAPRVIQIKGDDIYVSLDGDGITTLDVYREETVVDRSGAPLRSRLRLGTLRMLRPGDRFSIVRAPQGVEVRVGDLVQPRAGAARPSAAATTPPAYTTVAPVVVIQPNAPRPPSASGSTALTLRAPTGALHSALQSGSPILRAANLDTSDRLDLTGGYVSYGPRDHFGQFGAQYAHYFYHAVVHSVHFGGGGLLGEVPEPGINGTTTDDTLSMRFYYGLAGIDLTLTEWLGVEFYGLCGVTVDGVGGGGFGAWRVGRRDGVNVRAGGWLRTDIGHEGFLALEIPIGQRFKLIPQVVIDNMPRGDEMGFRALLGSEIRLNRHFGLSAEVGGAARDAKTGGFVGNLGLTFHL